MTETIEPSFEIVSRDANESLERASIDAQITTARRYPRTLSTVKAKMLSFATLDVETASGCFYTLPGRKGGDGKPIQGPSVRMAEIALASYQNIKAGSRVISDDGKIITAQAVCHDLENNVCISVEVKRRVTGKDGRRYSDDMVVTTGNAACSIALRNVTFRVVPLALVKPVYEQAKRVAIGDAKTLVARRADALNHFLKMGVSNEKVLTCLGVAKSDDITLENLELLIGYATSIKDGDTTIDEVFNTVHDQPANAPSFAKSSPTSTAPSDPVAEPKPKKQATEVAAAEKPQKPSPKTTLEHLAKAAGVSFDDLQGWLVTTGRIKSSDFGSIDELPIAVVNELLANNGAAMEKCATIYGGAK